MEKNNILTTKELAQYIRIHEKDIKKIEDDGDYLNFMASGQWKFELASIDHCLQKQLIKSSDEDLDLVIRSNDYLQPLSRMLDETLIELDLRVENKSKALSKLAKIASAIKAASSYEELYLELESRERLLTTAVGNGIAIPHSRFPHQLLYRQPKLIVARSASGIEFGAPDHHKVHLLFMPCAPTQFIHLRMLAQIAKLIHFPQAVERLKNASKKDEIISIFYDFEK